MRRLFTKQIKTAALLIAGTISLLVLIHLPRNKSEKPEHSSDVAKEQTILPETEKMQYQSKTLPEDCQLCGKGTGTLIPAYRNQNNLGIISLNTFTLSYVEINPYDEHGKPMERPANGSSTLMRSSGDNGYNSFISVNQWRGYAHGSVTLNQDEKLDIEKAAGFLCAACLNRIIDECWDETPYGMGVIDFKTGEIRLFEKRVTAFQFNDYYITCDTREKREEDSSAEIDLLIFYCPERYEKEK